MAERVLLVYIGTLSGAVLPQLAFGKLDPDQERRKRQVIEIPERDLMQLPIDNGLLAERLARQFPYTGPA
ncbi:MAG: hypothetical protein ACJ8AD_14735 [Gemmatimonadaceae bacterium]